jgi:hypothetical protein
MDSEIYPLAGRDSETLIHKCCSDLAVSESRAIEILEWTEENCEARVNQSGPAKYLVSIEMFARVMVSYKNAWLGNRLLLYALNNSALDDVLNHQYPAEFAREAGCTKANAIKLLQEIQKDLVLPPRQSQRTVEAKQKMSDSRKAQMQ